MDFFITVLSLPYGAHLIFNESKLKKKFLFACGSELLL